MNVLIASGTRPNWIKTRQLLTAKPSKVNIKLLDLGQHYSTDLIKDKPVCDYSLFISESDAYDLTRCLVKVNEHMKVIYEDESIDTVVVFGDCISTLAAAWSAWSNRLRVVHVEAGARSYEEDLLEEKIRRMVDVLSQERCCALERNVQALSEEGLRGTFTGDLMLDRFLAEETESVRYVLPEPYIVATLHRRELLYKGALRDNMIRTLGKVAKEFGLTIIFPIHPHMRRVCPKERFEEPYLVTKPIDYKTMKYLIEHAAFVVTDSGGLQKEAYWAGKRLITLRKATEWIETIKAKRNYLLDPQEVTEGSLKVLFRKALVPAEPLTRSELAVWGGGKATEAVWRVIVNET